MSSKRIRKPRTDDQKTQRKLRGVDKRYSVKDGVIYFDGKRVGVVHTEGKQT